MSEEIKSNGTEQKTENGLPQQPQTDFKVAEIWIKSGQIFLEGTESFWSDRCRAVGVLEFCKEIVKTAELPTKPEENKIITAPKNFMEFVRNIPKRKKK